MNPNPPENIGEDFTLETPGRYSYLAAIRQAVADVCSRAGIIQERTAQLEMAVDEACSNIIEHSYGGDTASSKLAEPDALRIHVLRSQDRVTIEIFDRGNGFDFEAAPGVAPSSYVDDGRQRGLGMYIIRCFVDDFSYQRGTPKGNCLRLTKLI